MKIRDFVNLTRNRANNQISFNLRSKQLRKIGITPEHLLNINLPEDFNVMKPNRAKKEVIKWKLKNKK